MKLTGKYSEAIIYTKNVEDTALEQIQELLDIESFKNSKIRIMPDVHAGKGCVIGFTANMGDKVIPNIVGVDIGCGMHTTYLGKVDLDLPKIDKFIHEEIPSGKNINQEKKHDFIDEINKVRCIRSIKGRSKEWNRAIGSLGGGNHFIEINEDNDQNKYLVIHSGSRNLGNRVANFYQQEAIQYHGGLNDVYRAAKENIIETYKKEGKRQEIQKRLKELKKEFEKEPTIPNDLCYLEGQLKEDYFHDMKICQRYAELNRETISKRILDFLFGHTDFKMFHTTHNYIDFNDNIIRKGAIRALENETVLIPINMRDGSILAKGKGNPDWNYSAPHGAGRLYSRTRSKELINLEDFKKSMEGIYTTCVNDKTIDESPMAYKSIDDIIDNIKDSVDIIKILKPIYNFKAS